MADFTVTSNDMAEVSLPGTACKMMVRKAPVEITMTASGDTYGWALEPGDVIPIRAGQVMRARRNDNATVDPVLVFEDIG